jgi:hypothetical protein
MESREDIYLLEPQLARLSVKVRGGRALEIKAYRDSLGILEVAGRAHGRMESWQNWSFPVSPPSPDSGDPPGWTPVAKRRRVSQFSRASRPIVAPAAGLGRPQCEVELTGVRTRGQDWWTLGFEATGPADLPRSELQATAALVFAQALPAGVQPGPDQSRSYAQGLSQRPGADSDASARRLSVCLTGWPVVLPATPRRPDGNARGDATGADHSGCQAGAATAWPKPSRADQLAGLEAHRTGRSAFNCGFATPYIEVRILGDLAHAEGG